MKTLKTFLVFAVLIFLVISSQGQDIFDAIKNNDLAKVKLLIDKDTSIVNQKDKAGNTLLHNAAIVGSVPITEFLLTKGADINAGNTRQNTPLLESILNGKDEVSKMLIGIGADIGKPNATGVSPLHWAAQYNRKEIAELLITKGADIDSKTTNLLTPLGLLTLMTDNYDIAKLLIEKGANVNAKASNGSTPLFNAAHSGSIRIIDLLLDNKADFDTINGKAFTMLSFAGSIGAPRLFRFALNKVGNEFFKSENTNKALMRSALNGGSLEIVNLLREKNIPLDLEANIYGWTPVHYCAANNKKEMLEFLVANGADLNKRTNSGMSAHNIAEENGNNDMMLLILRLGGNSEPQIFPELTGLYLGQKLLNDTPERFAPGIVTVSHSTISTSPDGNEMYWNSGASIMTTKIVNGQWTKPEVVSFSGKGDKEFYDDVPFVTPDNKKLFFMSMRPVGASAGNKENIWYVERTPNGWSEPSTVSEEVNAFGLHWQVSVSKNGNLYFRGRDESGVGIYLSVYANGKYNKPEKVQIDDGTSPFISPDESYIIFSKLIDNRRAVAYISYKSKEGKWLEPISLEKYIGNGVCCIVSPDGKYLFKDGSWVNAKFIEELRPINK